MSRYREILDDAAITGAYYRENPDEFVEDYFHIRLHLFQRIVLISNVLIASARDIKVEFGGDYIEDCSGREEADDNEAV